MRNQILNVKPLMLLLAIVLLTYGVQGVSYGDEDAVELELTSCDVNVDDSSMTVTGTVTALREVTNVRVHLSEGTGSEYIGDLAAGNSASFNITGTYFSFFPPSRCEVRVQYSVQPPKPPDCQVGEVIAPGESCTYPDTDCPRRSILRHGRC